MYMGGRQKKKSGKKKEAAKRRQQQPGPVIPDIEEDPGVELPTTRAAPADIDALADMAGLVTSFEDALQMEKEVASLEPEAHAAAAASAVSAEKGWAEADAAYEDLQRACEAHAKLWSQVDKLTPMRDEWHAKWQACEDIGREDTSMENQLKNKHISGQAATDKSQEFRAKARSVRASRKKTLQINSELRELTRQILNLQERYPINCKRVVDEQMREAALADDPARVMQALKPAEQATAELKRRRAELLSQECQKHQGATAGAMAGHSLEQLESLVERGVREGAGRLTVAERQAVARYIETGKAHPGSDCCGNNNGALYGKTDREQRLREVEKIKAQMELCKRKLAEQNASEAARATSKD